MDSAMEAVDGVFDNAKHVVDNAIDRIKKEIQLQKEKSDNMCKIKTAHNWQVSGQPAKYVVFFGCSVFTNPAWNLPNFRIKVPVVSLWAPLQ